MNTIEETVILDESFLDEECQCGMRHIETLCSVDVTHMFTHCRGGYLACENGATHMQKKMTDPFRCAFCTRPTKSCWNLRPA